MNNERRLVDALTAVRDALMSPQPGITDTLWMPGPGNETVVDHIDAALLPVSRDQAMQDARDDLLLNIGLSLMVIVQGRDDLGSIMSAGSLLQRTQTFMELLGAERASRPK